MRRLLAATCALAALAGGPAALADTSATVGTGAGANGSVVQVFDIRQPSKYSLNFRWCDGLTCGDADPECFSNKWIPSFEAPALQLRLPPASAGKDPFDRLGKVMVQQINEHEQVISTVEKAFQRQEQMLEMLRDIQLQQDTLMRSMMQNLRAHQNDAGRLCGLTDEQRQGFQEEFGAELDNRGNEHLRVTVVWERPEGGATLPPAMLTLGSTVLNSGHEGDAALAAMEVAGLGPADYPAFRQDGGDWSGLELGGQPFERTGSVPTTLANLLAAAGDDTDPGRLGQELLDRGAWKPGTGTALGAMRDFLTSKQLTVQETTLLGALGRLGSAGTEVGSVLAAYTDSSGRQPQENLVLLTGYDAARDRVTVLDPARGEQTMTTEQLAAGNPYLFQVATQRQQQALQAATTAVQTMVDTQLQTIRNLR